MEPRIQRNVRGYWPDNRRRARTALRQLKSQLRRRFRILHSETIIPDGGDMGLLRLVNSQKVNRPLEKLIGVRRVIRIKERLGLGKSLVVLAQKRPT